MTGISLSWFALAWIVMGTACFTIGLVHLILWAGKPTGYHYLFFAIAALAGAAFAGVELQMMQASSVHDMAVLMRWGHVILCIEILALVGFVQTFFRCGRVWLAWTVVLSRAMVLIANSTSDVNVNYLEIVSLGTIPFMGGTATVVAEGVSHPWSRFAMLSTFIFLAYVIDTSVRAWRNGDGDQRRAALGIGGSLSLTVLLAGTVGLLKHEGVLVWPYMVTPAFLLLVLAIGHELIQALVRSSMVADNLRMRDAQVRQLETRMELATEAAGIGVWEWAGQGHSVWMSSRARTMLGFDPGGEISASNFLQKLDIPTAVGLRGTLLQPDARREAIKTELRVEDADGAVRWLQLQGAVNPGGIHAGGVSHGVIIDITPRKEDEQRFHRLAEASPYAMLVVDRDGRIVEVNARAEALFEYDPGTLQGLQLEVLVPVAQRAKHESLRKDFHSGPLSRTRRDGIDVSALTSSGRTLLVQVWLTRMTLSGDDRVVAHIIDNTARMAAEHEQAMQREELAHLSRVSVMGELSGSLAHELNQPLAAIMANAQATQRLAANGKLTSSWLDEVLVDIVDETKRAGEIIRRMRAMLRRDQPEWSRVDLNEAATEVLQMVRSNISIRLVSVSTRFATALPPVLGDRVQLQQVLLNLLLNAIEAMAAQPSPRLLEVHTETDGDARVRLSVTDHGPGIAEDKLGKVFEPFFSTKEQGLGLGLAVCRTIIEYHGGTIHAMNNEGAGATFCITLPVLNEASP